MKKALKVTAWAVLPASAIFLALAPFSGIKSLTFYFIWVKFIVLTLSFNLIAGYVGYISFGHVAFFGVGGYIAAFLTWKMGLDFYPSLILGGLGSAGLAALLGLPLLKLRGAYFAIATIALNEALRIIIFNIPTELGGGSFGLPIPRIRAPLLSYYAMLITAIFLLLLTYLLVRSRFGLRLKAIREDEEAAESCGINAHRIKVITFALSALFMGIAGGLDLQAIGYIYPEAAFNIEVNVEMIAMTMLGGSGTVIGPLLGTTIFYFIADYIWARWPFSHLILLGLILGLLVLFMPRGILGTLEDRVKALRGKMR